MSDDLDDLIAEQMADPEFAADYEDAKERHRVLDALLAARMAAMLSQATVANRMGIKQPTVSEFESESSDPRLSTLQRYARAIGGRIVISFAPAGERKCTSACSEMHRFDASCELGPSLVLPEESTE